MSTIDIIKETKNSWGLLKNLGAEEKNNILLSMADSLEKYTDDILSNNKKDMENAKGKISDVMLDRLFLDEKRISAMASGIRDIVKIPDSVGEIISESVRPNGMVIYKKRVPLGLVAIIYESRPNVTSDAAALAVKSGNVCVLRGGKEAFNSSCAIVRALKCGIKDAGFDDNIINIVTDTTRESAKVLMTADGYVDLLIPRGGPGLINACVKNATVPCIQTGTGICHIYVDEFADEKKALSIIENAKTSRPSVCNAMEVCLVNRKIAKNFLPKLKKRLVDERKQKGLLPVKFIADIEAIEYIEGAIPAKDGDFDTEFLDYIMAVGVVDDTDGAVRHILKHSTGHSESIITENSENAEKFVNGTDSSSVYVNVSTRFTDGGEFGLGCEMGISTQKLHARGPMGINELTTYKYVILGNGQIR